MPDWASYALSDFILFAPETYWRLFGRMNASLWPLQVPLVASLAGLCIAAVRGWRHASAATAAGLAAAWALVAHVFLSTHYLPINWAVAWVIPLAWVQAGLMLVLGSGLRFGPASWTWPANALIATALAYPLVGMAFGRPVAQAEIAGMAPDPTALLTLGLLALARPGWRRLVLSLLPAQWCVVSAATLLTMGEPSALVPVTLLLLGLAVLLVPTRRAQTPN